MANPDPEVAHRKVIAERLLELTQHPAWDTLVEQLDTLERNLVERMVTGTQDEFDYHKGMIQGIRLAQATPQRLYREFLPGDST